MTTKVPCLMPEIKDSELCPVKSFIFYLEKLNPNNDRLWQRPKDSFLDTDEVWYSNVAVGKKSLSLFRGGAYGFTVSGIRLF